MSSRAEVPLGPPDSAGKGEPKQLFAVVLLNNGAVLMDHVRIKSKDAIPYALRAIADAIESGAMKTNLSDLPIDD